MSHSHHDRSIAVCGAGIAGLVLAIRLARFGFRPIVLEARTDEAIALEGEFLTLAPNGMNGLRAIACFEAVAASGIETRGIEILNARGRRLGIADQSDHPSAFGAPSVTLRRGVLARVLLDKATEFGIPVRLGTRIASVDQSEKGATISLDDGETIEADLVAAADGLRSIVREQIFPDYPKPQFTGLIATGGCTPAEVSPTGGMMRMTFGEGGFFGYIKEGIGPAYWFTSYWSQLPGEARASDPERFAEHIRSLHASDPFPNVRILDRVRRLERSYPIFDMPPLLRWWKERVVLVGDAAHAVGPHAGQGASMAIEDALILAACLDAEADHERAFARYEGLRRGRIDQVVALTARNRAQKSPTGRLGRLMRDLILPFVLPIGIRLGRRLYAFRADLAPLDQPV